MQKDDAIKLLIDLCQLDIDAVEAYDKAIAHIEDLTIKAKITQFKNDHEQHIADLSVLIANYGGEPPARTPDLKGLLITGFTALRSLTGTTGALKAMESNEKTTNREYQQALNNPNLPTDIKVVLEKNLGDERTHLAYIEQALKVAAAAS